MDARELFEDLGLGDYYQDEPNPDEPDEPQFVAVDHAPPPKLPGRLSLQQHDEIEQLVLANNFELTLFEIAEQVGVSRDHVEASLRADADWNPLFAIPKHAKGNRHVWGFPNEEEMWAYARSRLGRAISHVRAVRRIVENLRASNTLSPAIQEDIVAVIRDLVDAIPESDK